ncbi:MAG: hydantoinase/oxoprolinase family protein [Dethiobacter sp.]|jgi:N-methylhydantoinase A/acetophenone carboxylase|nr:MAG: hydantoinase/oxoprolinase family protein [Dethiobacter sp.]
MMSYTVNVDVGGTFMDFFVTKDDQYVMTKVPTTRYDLKVGFMRGLEESAEKFGESLEDFLKNTDIIKYSTTIGTNALIERSGSKLGLITTSGFEDTIFIGRARQWADGLPQADVENVGRIDKPLPLIPRKHIVGIRERVDYKGRVLIPLDKDDVLEKVGYLVDNGVRGFVVSLLWSFMNPIHERQIREIIQEEYPEVYLGNMPVILSSQVSPKEGEYVRTMTAIVNAYIHVEFADQLSDLMSTLIDEGYKKPVLLVDNVGGCGKASRTIAITTHNSSPVAGLCGASYVGSQFGYPNIVYTDVGGTSFDIGVIAEGSIRFYDLYPAVNRWRTQLTMIKTASIGAGGGSIAWLNPLFGNRLEVGPKSAGSIPGPACYDLGGEEPTVTDADVVLGYINPDYYLGGKMILNKEKALEAIGKLGKQVGWDEVTTALMIKKVVDARMGQEIFKEVAFKGYEPSEFIIFACGGAGPTHCCGVADAADMRMCYIPATAPVFGAFGAATLDIVHKYERSQHLRLFDYATSTYFNEYDKFNSIVSELKELATEDITLEGFSEEQATFKLELEMRYGTQWRYTHIESPILFIQGEEDVKRICNHFTEEFKQLYGGEAAYPEAGIEVETFRLFVTLKLPRFMIGKYDLQDEGVLPEAIKEERECYWEALKGFSRTKIYEWDMLRPGNLIEGPAVIEAQATTVVVEHGWIFQMDEYRNGVLRKQTTKSK